MKAHTALIVLLFLALIPYAAALDPVPAWDTSCVNESYIQKTAMIQNRTGGDFLLDAGYAIPCTYGCNTNIGICHMWPENAIPSEYYMIMFIFGIAILSLSIFRLGVKSKEISPADIIFSLLASGLFFILSLQGNNVIDPATGEAVQIIMVVWYCIGFAWLSVAIMVFNLFKFLQREVEDNG